MVGVAALGSRGVRCGKGGGYTKVDDRRTIWVAGRGTGEFLDTRLATVDCANCLMNPCSKPQ